jgi:hypothetical protein
LDAVLLLSYRPNMRLIHNTSKFIAMGLLLFGAATAPAEPVMSVANTVAAPGTTNFVAVSITIDTNVVSLQFDLTFSTNYLTPGTPVGGNALSDQALYSAVQTNGAFRVLAVSFTDSSITNGVVAYVPFTIAGNSPDHDEPLLMTNVVLANAAGESVPVIVNSNATISITVPPRFDAIFPTNDGAIHLELAGTPGRVYVIQAATNLVEPQWGALVTNTNVTGILPFDDTSASDFPARFYRAAFSR